MNHVSALLSRLNKVKGRGRHRWSACCPSHADKSPSLSVAVGDKGQVMIYCHAGCSAAEVISALGLSFADLYPPDARHRGGLQTHRSPLPRWARPGNEERLRNAVGCLFMLCVQAYPLGSAERELAAFSMGEASGAIGGVI